MAKLIAYLNVSAACFRVMCEVINFIACFLAYSKLNYKRQKAKSPNTLAEECNSLLIFLLQITCLNGWLRALRYSTFSAFPLLIMRIK